MAFDEAVVRSRRLDCPRCGYAMGGVVSSWTTSCPLMGQCTECGLRLSWAERFNTPVIPWWCLEGGRRNQFPHRLLLTQLMTLHPFRLWSSLRMEHHIRPLRIVCGLLLVPVLVFLVMAVSIGLDARAMHRQAVTDINNLASSYRTDLRSAGFANGQVAVTWSHSADVTMWHAMSRPFSVQPLFTCNVVMTPAIRPPVAFVNTPPPSSYWSVAIRSLHLSMAFGLSMLLSTVAFTVLPVARARAKVQWRHLMRACLYGLLLMTVIRIATPYLPEITLESGLWLSIYAAWILMVWWLAVTARYLRMQRAIPVSASVAAIGAFSMLFILALASGVKFV